MTAQLKLRHRLIYFVGIGGAAAFVHLFTVFNLVKFIHIQALVANVLAFLIAFNVSFLGHKYLTFSQLRDEKNLSLPHFFLVAASAGIMNEMLYFCFYAIPPLITYLLYFLFWDLFRFIASSYQDFGRAVRVSDYAPYGVDWVQRIAVRLRISDPLSTARSAGERVRGL